MAGETATPVIVGVGDVLNKSLELCDAVEPMELMLQAINLAIKDTNVDPHTAEELAASIDSLDVVATWTWPYTDLPTLISSKLGIKPRHKYYSIHSGSQPAKLLDEAARRISLGQSKVAVVTGGEALASLTACAAANKLPPPGWTKPDHKVYTPFSPTTRKLEENLGSKHSIGAPIQLYPLYENGFRAHRGQTMKENIQESAQLYAEFAKVAEKNPLAWNHGKTAETAESIGKITNRNRMICYPYPLLMNAFNTVNLSGACLLTSSEYATILGIPKSKWIYPLGGAGTRDSINFWERPNYHTSPSISRSLDAGMDVSGLKLSEIDLFDFYSCFPIVPKLACYHLGLSIIDWSKPITLLGGLTSFGGAGNNYSMHAMTEVVRELRKGHGNHGLILANGGAGMTYQHVVCLSSKPRRDGSSYPSRNPLPEVLTDVAVPVVDEVAEGEALIETYTVEFNRDGSPLRGYIVGRLLSNNHRFIANEGDTSTLMYLSGGSEEPIGRKGIVKTNTTTGRNLFSLETGSKL